MALVFLDSNLVLTSVSNTHIGHRNGRIIVERVAVLLESKKGFTSFLVLFCIDILVLVGSSIPNTGR